MQPPTIINAWYMLFQYASRTYKTIQSDYKVGLIMFAFKHIVCMDGQEIIGYRAARKHERKLSRFRDSTFWIRKRPNSCEHIVVLLKDRLHNNRLLEIMYV